MSYQDEAVDIGLSFLGSERENKVGLSEAEKANKNLKDPLHSYLRDVGQYPLLTEEERIRAFKRYRDLGDQETKNMLIVSNLRLVVKIAFRYRKRTRFPLTDLIQEGNLGLIRAVEKYDPNKGAKFSYYAAFWIKALILKYIMDNWSLLKFITSENKRKLFHRLKKEKERLRQLGIETDTEMLADSLQVNEKDILDIEKIFSGSEVSLDQPLSSKEGSRAVIDFIPSKVDTEETVSEKDLKEKGRAIFDRFRKTLTKRELIIFDNRICCEEALVLEEIGTMLGLSRERIRQKETMIYEKLYNFKEVEEAMALKVKKELTGVTLTEVEAVTRKKSKARQIALLYFGLPESGIGLKGDGLKDKEIVDKTGIPRSSVSSNISQIKQRIRDLRRKQGHEKESVEPPTGQSNRTMPKANGHDLDQRQVATNIAQNINEKEVPSRRELVDGSIHLLVERGSKRFEMNLSGGPIYDLLVKYLGL